MNTNDLLQRLVDLWEADLTARGVSLPPSRTPPPIGMPKSGWSVEDLKKDAAQSLRLARSINDARNHRTPDEDDVEDTLPPAGGDVTPAEFWKRRT